MNTSGTLGEFEYFDATIAELKERLSLVDKDPRFDLEIGIETRVFGLFLDRSKAAPSIVIYQIADPAEFHAAIQMATTTESTTELERINFYCAFMWFLDETHSVEDLVLMVTKMMDAVPELNARICDYLLLSKHIE